MDRCWTIGLAFCFGIVFGLGVASTARAGIGPENVIVVVNADSVASRTIANHYVHLRDIPESNVVLLRDVPKGLQIPLASFKDKILEPLLAQLDARKISAHVRVIAYSADFPTSVGIGEHTARLTDPQQKSWQLPVASINGLTYLYQFISADSEKYLAWSSNLYARGAMQRHFANPFQVEGDREAFAAASKQFAEEAFDQAAKGFEKLFEQHGSLSPLAIRAAESFAKAGDEPSAKRMLIAAIASGWSSARYLKDSETLGPLLGDGTGGDDTGGDDTGGGGLTRDPNIIRLMSIMSDQPTVAQDPVGFSASAAWNPIGYPTGDPKNGVRYLMSCSLAVVHPLGSTVDQAVDVLKRSAVSDRTYPEANCWFTHNGDVRTKTRFPAMPDALLWLGSLGHPASITRSVIPTESGKCVGLMLGTPTMNFDKLNWSFVPGAIAENLTSHSGNFSTTSQTKCTELLHAGASITSGPVTEPYTLPFKFPTPIVHGFYASGTSAIEAFYLTVTSPYQLLIIGDPLCQPFANPPRDQVSLSVLGRIDGKTLRIQRSVSQADAPESSLFPSQPSPALGMELYIDGRRLRQLPPLPSVDMNFKQAPPGVLEIRTVLVGAHSTRPQISRTVWMKLDDQVDAPEAVIAPDAKTVECRYEGAERIEFIVLGEPAMTAAGNVARWTPDRALMGDGPLRIRPVAVVTRSDGQETRIGGNPILLP